MIRIHREPFDGTLAEAMRVPAASAATLYWLGQAGFVVRAAGRTILIDPYLSDSLAIKYRGREPAHERMMPAPIEPGSLVGIDAVLCTHRHGDHMDPGTLPAVARNNPGCRFVVPEAEWDEAVARGAPADSILGTDAGRTVEPCAGVSVTAVPSAHETLSVNDRGENRFLGYIVRAGGVTLYHSGDCVPWDGLVETLRDHPIDAALLPINGRSPRLAEHGIAGNFDLGEAVDLCRSAGIQVLICHHYGMFAFNTVDVPAVRAAVAGIADPRCVMAETGVALHLQPAG